MALATIGGLAARAKVLENPDVAELLKYNREGLDPWRCFHTVRDNWDDRSIDIRHWRCCDCGETGTVDLMNLRATWYR